MLRGQKGITLVALVVTIIVLIILAGVSISLLFSEYGVVTRAQEAQGVQTNAAAYEDETLANVDSWLEENYPVN